MISSTTSITKAQFLPEGGIYAEYETRYEIPADAGTEDGELQTVVNENTATRQIIKHPDLEAMLSELREHLGAASGVPAKQVNNITVKSIVFKDMTGENPQAKIAGKTLSWDGQSVPLHTPLVNLETTGYPKRDALKELLIRIQSEVSDYLFQGKCANPTLFDQISAASPERKPRLERVA